MQSTLANPASLDESIRLRGISAELYDREERPNYEARIAELEEELTEAESSAEESQEEAATAREDREAAELRISELEDQIKELEAAK
jgi:chromosome segregation ATPase